MAVRYTISATQAKDDDGKELGYRVASYLRFMERNPDYDAEYWERLQALYTGGAALLDNNSLMDRIFPRHRGEEDLIYNERRDCSHYIPYAAEIIGNTIMGASADPLVYGMDGEDKELPEFYQALVDDTSRPGKKSKVTLTEFATECLLKALIKKVTWVHVDLPKVEGDFSSEKEEDDAGARRVYLVGLENEDVTDWEVDEDGDLLWAIIMKTTNRRSTPDSDRSEVTQEYTVLDREEYQVWEITFKKDEPPTEKSEVRLVAEGPHSFGVVPLVRLELPDALWSMNKMESACRALLRDINSMHWAMRQSLHQELYEFLGPEFGPAGSPVNEKQEDSKRATNQRRGQGRVQERGADDRAEYVGPPTDGFEFALKVVEMHRNEMHRINNQQDANSDVDSGTIRRSAESKGMDKEKAESLGRELGRRLKLFISAIFNVARLGRGEKEEVLEGLNIGGMTKFTERSTEGHLENTVLVQTMRIESPTFDRAMKLDVIKTVWGDSLSDEQLESIEEELEQNITEESFGEQALTPAQVAAITGSGGAGDGDDDDGTADDDPGMGGE